MEKLLTTIVYISKNGKGFKIPNEEDQWYTAKDGAIDQLGQCKVGYSVEIEFEKNGIFRNVSAIKIVAATESATAPAVKPAEAPKAEEKPKAAAKPAASGPKCAECGKVMKDDKFKKCYDCNQKAKVAATEAAPAPTAEQCKAAETDVPAKEAAPDEAHTYPEASKVVEEKGAWKPKTNYGSAEDIAGKEVGCAANCTAALMSNMKFETPQKTMEAFRFYSKEILSTHSIIKINKEPQ